MKMIIPVRCFICVKMKSAIASSQTIINRTLENPKVSCKDLSILPIGGILLLGSLIVLASLDQDDVRHNFGHKGGFACPFVPFLSVACILINSYLLIDLGLVTWIRVSVWFAIGALVYMFYGQTHSSLVKAINVHTNYVDEIYRSSDRVA